MAYQAEGQQRQFRVWGQGQGPTPYNNNAHPQPQQSQWIQPSERWGAVSPDPKRMPTHELQGLGTQGQGPSTAGVFLVLFKIFVLAVGIAAATFGIIALADPPLRYSYNCYNQPGIPSFCNFSYSPSWPTDWLVNLICQSTLVCADILIASILFMISLAKPNLKLGTVLNTLLVLFNVLIGLVAIWLLVALLVAQGNGDENLCTFETDESRCGRRNMIVCATVFSLLLPIFFIPAYLRWCCSLNVVIK